MTRDYTIVIFDGVCTLCNHTVDFLMRHDPSGEFRFASFQSPIGEELLASHGVVGPPTTVYVITRTNTLIVESDAMIHLGACVTPSTNGPPETATAGSASAAPAACPPPRNDHGFCRGPGGVTPI